MTTANHNLRSVAEAVGRALVDVDIKGGSAFISTPILYPSGAQQLFGLMAQAIVGSCPMTGTPTLRPTLWGG
jgi:hypothetical protein